jgi:hypothetical protein
MQYASYKALSANPAVLADFLEKATAVVEGIPKNGENWARMKALGDIKVGDAAFSMSKLFAAVEMNSADWDIDEDDVTIGRFVESAKTLASVYPDFDVRRFTFGFESMPGADLPAQPAKRAFESDVKIFVVGAPGMGATVLGAGSRIGVTTSVHDEGARRVMRPR